VQHSTYHDVRRHEALKASVSKIRSPATTASSMIRSLAGNLKILRRRFATAVKHHVFGDPQKVLRVETYDQLNSLGADDVHIKFLAAPINPSDINMVQGVYGVTAKLPAVGGNEGVAIVVEVGKSVSQLAVGDWVIPFRSGFGCWRTDAVTTEDELIKISNDIPPAYAATLSVNPATAYRLLRDFGNLKAGDVIMQNGANSMVGLAVIQIARMMGIKTVNIIRSNRPRAGKMLKLLSDLGGDVNVFEEQVNTPAFHATLSKYPPCKLGFNCIGGDATTNMIRCLAPGGTVVTYGGMSKRALTVPVDVLTAKQLKLEGFWMAKWYEENGAVEKGKMIEEIINTVRRKELTFFHDLHDFKDFSAALHKSQEEYSFKKIILDFGLLPTDHSHDERSILLLKDFEANE
jgi:mitochondrial enoyl-[acyl-carrier protein] reductase / trans-2-enoyl-CoA reductase